MSTLLSVAGGLAIMVVISVIALAVTVVQVIGSVPATAATSDTGIVVVGGSAVIPDGIVEHLESCTADGVQRVAGADRYATAAAIADAWLTADTVFLATGLNYPDALGGGPVAALNNAPILLTQRNSVPAVTNTALSRLSPNRIVLLGGTAVISSAIENDLRSRFSEVIRLAGVDRYETAAAVSQWHFTGGASTVYVATGLNYLDALVAGPSAAAENAPLLLVTSNSVPAATASELQRLNPDRIVLVGSSSVVSESVEAELADYTSSGVTRIAGASRYSTAAAVAARASGERVFVVTANNFPDGLAATPATHGAPIVFVSTAEMNATTADAIAARTGTACETWTPPYPAVGSELALDELRCGTPSGPLISSQGGPVPVIFDTDFGSDVDDVGALAILHAMADRGETEILGVMLSTSGDFDGPRAVDVVNTYYGRPDIPIGLADPLALSFPSSYTAQIASAFENEAVSNPTATSLYRRLLAAQPDRSVTIISVGFTSNLDDLLLSGPDEFSPLSGTDLVAEKVKLWVAMAGHFPNSDENPWGGEWNLVKDVRASITTTASWPTPIVFSGFEVGSMIRTGAVLQTAVPEDNPVREAYRLFTGGSDRESWDLTAVWYAVRGPDPFFDTCPGRIEVSADGSNGWAPDVGDHAYLSMKVEPDLIAEALDELLVTPPAGGAVPDEGPIEPDERGQ